MPRARIVLSTPVARSPRVLQLEGMFDIPPAARAQLTWDVDLPLEEKPWNIGLIVGPSGCGKTTVARALFGGGMAAGFRWSEDRSLLDDFPRAMPIKELVELLCSVGFS